jgi:hypothetical protein
MVRPPCRFETSQNTPVQVPRTLRLPADSDARGQMEWVMAQVGHADSRITVDVYAQLKQRVSASTARASNGSCARPSVHDEQPVALAARECPTRY